jgi:hypothetical protein
VGGRDFQTAAQMYAQCSNPNLKSACRARMAPAARKAAEFSAKNEKCAEARTIMNSAVQMGVPPGQFAQTQALCPK